MFAQIFNFSVPSRCLVVTMSHCHKASQIYLGTGSQPGVGGSATAQPRQDYFIPRVLLLPATARTWHQSDGAYLDPIFGMKMKIFKSVEPHHNEIISAWPIHLNYQKHFKHIGKQRLKFKFRSVTGARFLQNHPHHTWSEWGRNFIF